MKKLDLSNQIINDFIVIKESNNKINNRPLWDCKCVCGNIKQFTVNRLTQRPPKNCGCSRKVQVGKKFNKLIVIKKTNNRNNRNQILWECKCDCGNIKEVSAACLTSDNVTSCGCIRKSPEIGGRYGLLTVIKKLEKDKHGHDFWQCHCDCGNKNFKTRGYSLTTGNCQSCNCKRISNRKNKKMWKGYEEITGKIWSSIQRGAKSRNLEFLIKIEDAWDLYLKQNRKCALSGFEIIFAPTNSKNENGYTTASLDRIDSSKGYTIDNIQWLHKDVNCMKQNFNEEYMFHICKNVYINNKEKYGKEYTGLGYRDRRN